MPTNAIRGQGIGLPQFPGFGSQSAQNGNRFQMLPATSYLLNAGEYMIALGNYIGLECLDPVIGRYLPYSDPGSLSYIAADGVNFRLANKTGTPVGATITTAGSSLTNGIWQAGVRSSDGATTGAVTVTPSAGGSTWTVIVGGAVSATVTQTAAGTLYTFAPQVFISAPPAGGFQATAHATISGGGVTVVMDNLGAGYTSAPTVTIINDPRDSTGSGAVSTLALTGSGTITGMYPISFGTVLTAVPTFTFSPTTGSPAATAVMNFAVTGYTVGTAGSTYTGLPLISGNSLLTTATSVLANPAYTTGLTSPRAPRIVAALSAGGITATGLVVEDGGFGIQQVPTPLITTNGVTPLLANAATVTLTVGGLTDSVFIQSI